MRVNVINIDQLRDKIADMQDQMNNAMKSGLKPRR